MSKFVKDLITKELQGRLEGVKDLFLVNIVGLNANANSALRKELRGKGIQMVVVKNSLARRAAEGSTVAPAFDGAKGTLAVLWGEMDAPALAKEIVRLQALQGIRAVRSQGRSGRRDAIGRRAGGRGQQVADPSGTVESAARPDPLAGRLVGQPVDERGRGPGQPDQTTQ